MFIQQRQTNAFHVRWVYLQNGFEFIKRRKSGYYPHTKAYYTMVKHIDRLKDDYTSINGLNRFDYCTTHMSIRMLCAYMCRECGAWSLQIIPIWALKQYKSFACACARIRKTYRYLILMWTNGQKNEKKLKRKRTMYIVQDEQSQTIIKQK